MTEMHNSPRVSIGMPVYNGERYLGEALNSLLAQTFDDFELIICDNASTDKTGQISRSFAARDARIRYFRNSENLGAAQNYRRTFKLSSGEYFRWANCDDLFAPNSLECCVKVLDQKPSIILTYPKTKFIDDKGQIISTCKDELQVISPKASRRFFHTIARLGYVNAIYGLMRAHVLRQTGLIRNFEGGDIVLVAELSLYGKFWQIPEFLFYRRLHPGAHSNCKDIAQIQEFFDPMTKGQIPLTVSRHLWAYFDSICRAPLSISEKMRLHFLLTRIGIWRRRQLLNEILEAIRHLINRFPLTF